MEPVRLFLSGGPADEVRVRRPEWHVFGEPGVTEAVAEKLPDRVWLCRVEWPEFEWRVRLRPEMIRGKSALYRLERNPDGSPAQAVSGAVVYAHVPDEEIGEHVPEDEAKAARGPFQR